MRRIQPELLPTKHRRKIDRDEVLREPVQAVPKPRGENPEKERLPIEGIGISPECVAVQSYSTADIATLLDLWAAFNFHLAHIMEQIPDAKLQTPCTIGDYPTATLAYLLKDYNDHLAHHLAHLTS